MTLHPHNNTALCKLLNETDYETKANGIYFRQEELPIYEVIERAWDSCRHKADN